MTKEKENKTINEFIRDVTSTIPRPKSEVRRRLNEILEQQKKEVARKRRKGIVKSIIFWTIFFFVASFLALGFRQGLRNTFVIFLIVKFIQW